MGNEQTAVRALKRQVLTACYTAKEGHVASAYSILDILYVLYHGVLNCAPDRMDDPTRDRFVLSKGHAAIGYYAVLADAGYVSEPLENMCSFGSSLGGHPDSNKVPGVEVSTGSLGHGVPMAVGMAWALKLQGNDAHVYALAGDGEINEGAVWESLLIADHHKLNNFTLILDYNHSTDRAVDLGCAGDKLSAFGFKVIEIDGHDHAQIKSALLTRAERPVAVIANTVKGRGIREMTNEPAWHHRIPTQDEYERFMEELA